MSTLLPHTAGPCVKIPRPLPKQKMREIVLQALYALDIDPMSEQALVPLLTTETLVARKHVLAALNTAKEILAKSHSLDVLVSQTIKNTSFDKLSLMEKNVLRLALFEYLYHQPSTAPSVLISEAIRLVKKFSYIGACTFVHAVLNDIFRSSIPMEEPALLCC